MVPKICIFGHPGIFSKATAKRLKLAAPNLAYKLSRLKGFFMQNFEYLLDLQVSFFGKKCPKNALNNQNFGFLGINAILRHSGSQNLA